MHCQPLRLFYYIFNNRWTIIPCWAPIIFWILRKQMQNLFFSCYEDNFILIIFGSDFFNHWSKNVFHVGRHFGCFLSVAIFLVPKSNTTVLFKNREHSQFSVRTSEFKISININYYIKYCALTICELLYPNCGFICSCRTFTFELSGRSAKQIFSYNYTLSIFGKGF